MAEEIEGRLRVQAPDGRIRLWNNMLFRLAPWRDCLSLGVPGGSYVRTYLSSLFGRSMGSVLGSVHPLCCFLSRFCAEGSAACWPTSAKLAPLVPEFFAKAAHAS